MLSVVSEQSKSCPKCGEEKFLSAFAKDKSKKLGVSSYCKDCSTKSRLIRYRQSPEIEKQKQKEYYSKNKHVFKGYSLKALYGLNQTQFNAMRSSQNYSCKICKTHENNLNRGLFVDHCHETGKIRGLLCQSCNTMLGNAKDSILVLQAGIDYLSGKHEIGV